MGPATSHEHVPPTIAAAPWLELHSVCVSYGPKRVVDHLSLSLERGQIGCLLGPSGCGKSTVLRAIAGFEPVQDGSVRLDGRVVSSALEHCPPERRHIGMVFQDHALFPHLTIGQNVGFGIKGQAGAQARVRELLERVDLDGVSQRYPHQLSGGQQQRVALARALAPQPQLLLMDEPFSSLDVDLRERLGAEVRVLLKGTGTTALLVTHDQHEAFSIADEVGVMREGCIQQWASPYALYHQPANREVADFVGQGSFLPGEVVDGHHVTTELGIAYSATPIRCTEHGDLCNSGCEVDVLLRPDDVVHDDSSPTVATVQHKAFRGAHFLYTLSLDSGASVLSLVPSHHDHPVGERIGIRLEQDHVVAYRR